VAVARSQAELLQQQLGQEVLDYEADRCNSICFESSHGRPSDQLVRTQLQLLQRGMRLGR